MRINQLWAELAKVSSFTSGLMMRRYSSTVLPDVYVGLRAPEKHRCLVIKLSHAYTPDTKPFNNLKDISFEIVPDEQSQGKNMLLILLLNNEHRDVFSTLCEDLIQEIRNVGEERALVRKLTNRYEKWKALFDKAKSTGLNAEQQQGLYGELFFLRKWISYAPDRQKCIRAWLGPEKAVRDFQDGSWAVEVKTTRGNNHQLITINSERQLDTTGLDQLYLFHLSLDVRQSSGESLNDMVESVAAALRDDVIAYHLFQVKLLEAGYFAVHQPLYSSTGYHIREDNIYHIRDEFPRIEEHDIRKGVGGVKYTISISDHTSYIADENLVIQHLN
ncbi:PD-(D/E)XK motif protein [Pontibacter sp. KCTC 32443]|nr:PD-(D/E)XK motif protein [Pontibacter deserti]MBC5774343.1 PD-(D/E)XK motif protein [Pontibacter sp. KCTC 32443]